MRLLIAVLSMLFAPAAAALDWMIDKRENPFEKSATYFAWTVGSPAAVVGFRCVTTDKTSAEAGIVFVIPERADDDALKLMATLGAEISVIVDDEEAVDLKADADSVDVAREKRVRLVAYGPEAVAIAGKMASAKRRIAIAAKTLGRSFHPTMASVRGSRARISAAIGACGLVDKAF